MTPSCARRLEKRSSTAVEMGVQAKAIRRIADSPNAYGSIQGVPLNNRKPPGTPPELLGPVLYARESRVRRWQREPHGGSWPFR